MVNYNEKIALITAKIKSLVFLYLVPTKVCLVVTEAHVHEESQKSHQSSTLKFQLYYMTGHRPLQTETQDLLGKKQE